MFTGIVSAVGEIIDVTAQDGQDRQSGVRLTVQVQDFLRATTKIGDSIAIQGACMTVVGMGRSGLAGAGPADLFMVDVSRESLNLTSGLDRPGPVNLEHSLRLGDTLDGHLVSGHIDGLGTVSHFKPVGESWDLRVRAPRSFAPYLAYKGSITINGVSLTVNQVDDDADGCEIRINLIPHTVQVTTFQYLRVNDKVNLEIDMIARYVERAVSLGQ